MPTRNPPKRLRYQKRKQQNGHWAIREYTVNQKDEVLKTRTIYKDKTHAQAEDILFRLERGLPIV